MRFFALEITMSDQLRKDPVKSKQAARPIFWILGFVAIISLIAYWMV